MILPFQRLTPLLPGTAGNAPRLPKFSKIKTDPASNSLLKFTPN